MSLVGAIIGWIVFGLVVGAIARLLMPGPQPMGVIATAILGMIGSVVGGLIYWAAFGAPGGRIEPASWILSIICAIIVLWIYGAATARGTARRT